MCASPASEGRRHGASSCSNRDTCKAKISSSAVIKTWCSFSSAMPLPTLSLLEGRELGSGLLYLSCPRHMAVGQRILWPLTAGRSPWRELGPNTIPYAVFGRNGICRTHAPLPLPPSPDLRNYAADSRTAPAQQAMLSWSLERTTGPSCNSTWKGQKDNKSGSLRIARFVAEV